MNRDAGTSQEQLHCGEKVRTQVGISCCSSVANALVEKQRIQLVNMHKDGCPWKKRQCDGGSAHPEWRSTGVSDLCSADVYRIPLSTSAVMAKEIKTRARSLESVLEGIEIKHPLVQLTRLSGVPYLIVFALVLYAS
jgi:hypothetical protein